VAVEDTPGVMESVELNRTSTPSPLDDPTVLSLGQTAKMLAHHKARTASNMQGKRDDVQVRLQDRRCRRCQNLGSPGIGHTADERDAFGIKVVSTSSCSFWSQ
jgi:hypothetical protein